MRREIKLKARPRGGVLKRTFLSLMMENRPGDRGHYVIISSPVRWSGDARLLEVFCIQTVIRTSARRRNAFPVSVRPEFIASNVVKDELRLQSRIRGHITEVYSHLIADPGPILQTSDSPSSPSLSFPLKKTVSQFMLEK